MSRTTNILFLATMMVVMVMLLSSATTALAKSENNHFKRILQDESCELSEEEAEKLTKCAEKVTNPESDEQGKCGDIPGEMKKLVKCYSKYDCLTEQQILSLAHICESASASLECEEDKFNCTELASAAYTYGPAKAFAFGAVGIATTMMMLIV